MSGINRVTILGRVGKDPEAKTFSSGGKVVNFSVATSETWKDKNSGEKKEKTEWHRVTIRNDNLCAIVEKYVSKGDLIYLEGKIETREWEKDGQKHYATEVILGFDGKVMLLGNKKDDADGGGRAGGESSPARQRVSQDPDDSDIPF